MSAPVVTVGPFTWKQMPDHGNCEVWDLQGVDFVHFALKHYSGEPGPGFAGWKLVSGGPYDCAGSYATREAAMVGVVPWLSGFLLREVQVQLDRAKALEKQLNGTLTKLKEAP